MRKFWKHVKRWLVPAQDPRALTRSRRPNQLGFDALEERSTPAGNLSLTSVTLLDGNNNPIVSPVVGERITLKIDWNATGLAAGDQYVVRGTVGGIPLDSAVFTNLSSGNVSTTLTGWYSRQPAPTAYQVMLDANLTVAETDENDNTSAALSFNSSLPTTLPMKLVFPVANSAGNFLEWTVRSYVDLDPRVGTLADYNGLNLAIDQNNGLDVVLPTFRGMDLGRNRVVAAASGTVEAVVDGFDDRNTSGVATQGNYIRINHGNGWKTEYFNLAKGSTTLRPGEGVAQGQTIALVGSSGASTGPDLHFVLSHNGAPVEPFLLGTSYFLAPLGHQLQQIRRVINSGTTNYDPALELQEKPVDTTSFNTSPTFNWNAHYYAHINFLQGGETVEVRWLAPGNPTPVVTNTLTETNPVVINKAITFNIPASVYRTLPGTWNIQLLVNGQLLSTTPFLVTSGGSPNTHVSANGKYLSQTRTTPLEFGSTTVNGPGNNQSFIVTNIGSVAMNVFNITVPAGFAFVGNVPPPTTTLLPGQTLTFVVRIDANTVGEKTGALRFQTSAANGNFSYYLHGTVAGTPAVGAPSAFFPGSAATSFTGTAPFLLEPNATFTDSDSANLNGGRLTVEFLNTTLAENVLAIRNQGTGSGQIGTNGNNVTFGTQVIGTFATVTGTSLTVNFNSTFATPAAVQALLRNITYANSNAAPATGIRYIRFSVTDNTFNQSNVIVKAVYPAPNPPFSSRFLVTEPGGNTAVIEAGASDSYTIQLTQAPANGTTVTVTILPVSQVTTDKTTLVFNNVTFNIPQSITVTAIDDGVPEGAHRGTITHSVSSTDPLFDGALIPVVSPLISDNDVGLVISETFGSTTVSEDGATDTISFSLAVAPTADVTVTVTPNAQVSAAPTVLTFTPGNFNVPQTVTVAATEDGIIEGVHSGSLAVTTASPDAAYNNLSVPSVPVSILDNDFVGVRLNLPGTGLLTAEGGGTSSFAARLTSQPTADVVITLVPDAQVATNPTSLTFTPANWNIEQSVTVSAVNDNVAEGSHSGTFGLNVTSADAGYNGFSVPSQSVSILDNDFASVVVTQSGSSTDVAEGGVTDTLSFVLTSQPLPGRTVTISLNGGSQLTLTPPSVVLDNANWNIPQIVTVSAFQDTAIEGFHTQNISFVVTSNDVMYDQFPLNNISVNITDDDAPAVIITPSNGSTDVSENGAFDSFTIHLSITQPSSDVKVSFLANNQVTAVKDQTSDNFVIFTPANWNVPQTVVVNAVNDAVAEGNHLGSITFATESVDARYNGMTLPPHSVNIIDNDNPGIILTETTGSTAVTEAGNGDSISLVLTSQPTGDVTINLTPNAQVSATPATVIFTAANWNVTQIVTIGAVDDSLIEGTHAGVVSFAVTSADSRYNNFSLANLNVTVTDNDALGVVINQSGSATAVTEGGVPDTYTVVLTTPPFADVIINLTANTQLFLSPVQLIFTPSNYNIPQTVSVVATEDSSAEGNHSSLITHTASSTDARYNGIAITDVLAAITDNDVAGVQVLHSNGNTLVSEAGLTDTLVITLTSQPSANVVLNLGTDGQITTNPSSLSFSINNWNTPQVINVAAINDSAAEGNHNGRITFNIDSTDPVYAALNTPTPPGFDVPIQDNDTAGVTITQTGGNTTVSEGLGFDTYAVVLSSQPTADVVFNVNPAVANQLSPNPAALTFTAANWNVPQNVQVNAINDLVAEGTITVALDHTVASSDPRYSGIPLASVTVTVNDNDFAGIVIFPPTGISLAEGGSFQSYTVNLNSQPTADVTVNLNPGSQVTLSTPTLTFTPANWDVPQSVNVTAVDDTIAEGSHVGLVGHVAASTDTKYNTLVGPNLSATIQDNDFGVIIVETGGSTVINEGETPDTYQLRLSDQPTADVVVTLTPASPLVVSTTTVTFTPANWDTPQTITVSAPTDFNSTGPRLRIITHTSASADARFDAKTRDLTVTIKESLPDIIGRHPNGSWFVGRSTGSGFATSILVTWANLNWVDVRVGDFNGDGRHDLAGRIKESGDWYVSVSQPGGTYVNQKWGHWGPNVVWLDVKIGDFNGDGRQDIIGRMKTQGIWWISESTGVNFNTKVFGMWGANVVWVDVQTGDFDGDGKTDVVGRNLRTADWWVGRSTGTAFVNQHFGRWGVAPTYVDVRVGDLNGDGKSDILARALQSGNWFGGLSTGVGFTQVLFGNWGANVLWKDVQLSDFNGDGRADIAGRRGTDLFVGLSTGTSFTTSRWFAGVPTGLGDLLYIDFDGDGKADVGGRLPGGQVLVYLSLGTGFKAPALWAVWPVVPFKDVRAGVF